MLQYNFSERLDFISERETVISKQSLLLAPALMTALATPAFPLENGAKNMILMTFDEIAFNR